MNEAQSLHGVLVNIYNLGVFITGKSAVGKSALALQLLDRGHALIADDIVLFKPFDGRLIGSGPETLQRFIAVRDVGIINVTRRFGEQAFSQSAPLTLAIEINPLATVTSQTNDTLCDITYPKIITNYQLQPNLALWLETKAYHLKEQQEGYLADQVVADLNAPNNSESTKTHHQIS